MAYQGTTSTAPNVPFLVGQSIGSTRGKCWEYHSTHVRDTVVGAGFITDGQSLGMRPGHAVSVFQSTAGSTTHILSYHTVLSDSSTGVTLSQGFIVSSAS